MPVYCAAFGCKNLDSKELRQQEITFHKQVTCFSQLQLILVTLCVIMDVRKHTVGLLQSVMKIYVNRSHM